MKRENNKAKKLVVALSLCLITSASTVDAHSGRTDGSGGHRDNKNKSGLGSYHYHCGGYGPHLHTNGCPYKGGGSSSNSSSGGGTTSKPVETAEQKAEREERERIAREEKAKKAAKESGYNKGYNSGYVGEYTDINYDGEYGYYYREGYDEGYNLGVSKFEEEKEVAQKQGYDIGIAGNQLQEKEFRVEKLTQSYKEGYEKGYSEYKQNKIQEYTKLGLEEGKADIKKTDIENIDEDFKSSYEESFKQGQEILSKTYIEKGYNDAFENQEYKNPNYKKDKYQNWYKEGFDKAIEDIAYVTEVGYNDGYERNDQSVPKEFEYAKSIYIKAYEDGTAVADKEFKESTTTITGVATVGWIIRRYLVARKSIM